ncbi:MAG TPA: hypothetical protein VGM86_31875 [Thermoanaerobaculia bacterium]
MIEADIRQSRLYSEDLEPVPASGRTWGMASFAALVDFPRRMHPRPTCSRPL